MMVFHAGTAGRRAAARQRRPRAVRDGAGRFGQGWRSSAPMMLRTASASTARSTAVTSATAPSALERPASLPADRTPDRRLELVERPGCAQRAGARPSWQPAAVVRRPAGARRGAGGRLPAHLELGFRRRHPRQVGIGIPVTFWGKDSLFRVPLFGRWLRWLGGVPVRSHAPPGRGRADGRCACAGARRRALPGWLALAPEGTRAVRRRLAQRLLPRGTGRRVPLALVFLDGARRVGFRRFCSSAAATCRPTWPRSRKASARSSGRRPQLAAPIRFKP